MGADRIVHGPLSSDGLNHFDQQALVLDASNGILESSGDDRVLRACATALAVYNAQAALTTVTTAQNLISKTLNAGALNKANRVVRISGSLVYTTPGTTTPVLTLAVLLGSTSLCSIATAALSATASTNMPVQFSFELSVVTTGSSATIESHGQVDANITANTPAAAAACYLDTNTAVSSAVNLAGAIALKLQASADSAISSITLRQATIEIIN